MKYLDILRTVLALLPVLIDAIKAVEVALPASGQGATKLELVRQTLQAGYDAGTDTVVAFDQVWPALAKSASAVVTAMNAAGVFVKK